MVIGDWRNSRPQDAEVEETEKQNF